MEGTKVKKKESIASYTEEKLPEDEGYPFEKINEDVYKSDGFVESECYELRGTDSLRYQYLEIEVQYILWRREEKQIAVAEKEVIDLRGDSD